MIKLNQSKEVTTMSFVPDLARSCRENDELLADLARFSEGLYTEQFVRRKYRDLLNDDDWVHLATDDLLVEMVEAEKLKRVRNGAFKREKSQELIIKGPAILDDIMTDQKQSAKHRIDAIKTLDQLADNGPGAAPEADRVIIRIDLTAGGGEVVEFNKSLKVDPNPNIIDSTAQEQLEAIPPRRGPGRPPGSRNKRKTVDAEELLPFLATKTADGGGGDGNAI
jgi:hypothetical protein